MPALRIPPPPLPMRSPGSFADAFTSAITILHAQLVKNELSTQFSQ
jgi:hypothetical protein